MKYNITLYEPNITNCKHRFVLGTPGSNPLLVIGLNPSTANDKEPDQTMRRVSGYTIRQRNDSFIMLNIYPQRTPHPENLSMKFDNQLHNDNIHHIKTIINKYTDISILAAWGNDITIRGYLKKCLSEIYLHINNKKINWLRIGDLTQKGHPRHPSRGSYLKLKNFDIVKYLETFN